MTALVFAENDAKKYSKMATIGQSTVGLVHEINNPLAILIWQAEKLQSLLNETNTSPEIKNAIEAINKTSTKIHKITKSMTRLIKNENHDGFVLISLKSIFDDVKEMTAALLRKKKIELSISYPTSDDLKVKCRPTQIGQVLLNLIINSIEAMEKTPEKWIKVSVNQEEKFVAISITDSGEGVLEGSIDVLFHPYSSQQKKGERIGMGLGLGLSISKSLVEAHGGKIYYDIESKNTKFVILLPNAPN